MKSHPSRLQLQTSKSKEKPPSGDGHMTLAAIFFGGGWVFWPDFWLQMVKISTPIPIQSDSCNSFKTLQPVILHQQRFNITAVIRLRSFLWFNLKLSHHYRGSNRIICRLLSKKTFMEFGYVLGWEFPKWSPAIQRPHRFCNAPITAKIISLAAHDVLNNLSIVCITFH